MTGLSAQILRPRLEPGRRILVISDIHGNLPYLKGLLEKAGFCSCDYLIIDGDFLEKGEYSLLCSAVTDSAGYFAFGPLEPETLYYIKLTRNTLKLRELEVRG